MSSPQKNHVPCASFFEGSAAVDFFIPQDLQATGYTQTSGLPVQVFKLSSTAGELTYQRTVGAKVYELTDHLGNVRAVISDRKLLAVANPEDNLWDATAYYTPEIVSANDYYPGGMLQPGRHFNTDSYRYGYQGQEKDDEIAGTGSS